MSKSGIVHHESSAVDMVLRELEAPLFSLSDESRYYSYRRLGPREFLDGLAVCRDVLWTSSDESVGRKFLDVGCGIGTNLALAFWSGWDATGLEIHEPFVKTARELHPNIEIVHGDAWEFDRYGEFDVVYSYRPCVDDDDQMELYRHVMSQMRPGAIVFFGGGGPNVRFGELVGRNVWRV